ncbi:MAG: adenylate/guanylate cyclase domain-containing protein [Deltaproteobacteria bacterium]|nr:adenylate/guanylate cyclase domain-containing protein [Deltaproteobacteria bacterium]
MNIKSLFRPSYLKIAVGISIFFTAVYLISPSLFELIELKTIDARFRSRPPIAPGKDVVIAVIDEKSLDELGRWPWPRTVIAKLIDELTAYGVKVIAFDIVFSEPSENSEMNALLSLKEKYKGDMPSGFVDYVNKVKTEIDPDIQLGKAIKKSARVVLGYFFHFDKEAVSKDGRELSLNYQDVEVLKQGGEAALLNSSAIETNIDIIANGAKGFGYYNIVPDNDGSVRWNPLAIKYKDKYYAPLSVQALKAYLGDPPLSIKLTDYGVANIKLGETSIPVDESGRFLINYYGGQKIFPHYSIADIMKRSIEKENLEDKIVLIGSTAIGIYDMRVTPFEGIYPGVEIHATVIDNILNKRFLVRPQWFGLMDILVILGIGVFLGIIIPRLNVTAGLSAVVAFLGGYIYLSLYLFNNKGLLLNITYPVLAVVITYLCLALYRYAMEAKEKKKIKNTFQYYVAAPVMEELMKHPEKLKLGGEEKELTVLFSDIRRFTTISEGLRPDALIAILNEYLTAMSDVVFKYQGYLDKYIGDAIMAVYGAPLMQEDHAKKACLTAIEMMARLNIMRQEWKDKGRPFLDIGIGINTGNMVVGNVGSEQKYDYTVIGDNVNLASRLEGLNKLYGTNIIISETVRKEIERELLWRELDIVQVKGKTEAKTIYELMGRKNVLQMEEVAEVFHKGIKYYRERRWEDAIKSFNAVMNLKPEDAPSRLYIQRSREFITTPPPDNWQGIFVINR